MSDVLADAIRHANNKAMYNEYCKEILCYKPILSRILQQTVEEYENVSLDTIQQCIEGTPEISSIPVNPSNIENEKIIGCDTVSTIPGEGSLYYDIKFEANTPNEDNHTRMYINVEAQKNFYQKYPLLTRGVYYGARMISSQYGVELN